MSDSRDALPTPLMPRDWTNTAEWLRIVAEGAEVIPAHGDDIAITYTQDMSIQWLWPETRDELLAIAADINADRRELAALRAGREKVLQLCDDAEAGSRAVIDAGGVVCIQSGEIRAALDSGGNA
jgi:hypothetical protein